MNVGLMHSSTYWKCKYKWINEIAYFGVCWKTRKPVYFTAPNEELKLLMSRLETENGPISRESQYGMNVHCELSMVEMIYRRSKFWA